MSYSDMIAIVKRATSSIVDKYYPSKSNNEKMSLHDLIAFAIMAHIVFDGIYKKAYKLFIEELKIFPNVRYNKIVERLNRYEKLLIECLKLFKLEGKIIVDSKSLETKKLARFNKHKKRGKSKIIKDEENIGFNSIKKGSI